MNEHKSEIRKADILHIPFLLLHYFSIFLADFAIRGVWPFGRGRFWTIITIVFRGFAFLILYEIRQSFTYAIIVYLAFHLVIFILARIQFAISERVLDKLEHRVSAIYEAYIARQLRAHQIDNEQIIYGHGIVAGNGCIRAPMNQESEHFRIYNLDPAVLEYKAYYDRLYNAEEKGILVCKHIASTEFNNKFGVVAETGDLRDALQFFSPTVQLQMIKDQEIRLFSKMEIKDGVFTADVGEPVQQPGKIDAYWFKPFFRYFKDVDSYCKQMKKMGDIAYRGVIKLNFINAN